MVLRFYPHGPLTSFDTNVRIVTTRIGKIIFRVLPLHHTAMLSSWLQWKESDLLLVLLMNVILHRHLLHGPHPRFDSKARIDKAPEFRRKR